MDKNCKGCLFQYDPKIPEGMAYAGYTYCECWNVRHHVIEYIGDDIPYYAQPSCALVQKSYGGSCPYYNCDHPERIKKIDICDLIQLD